MSALFGHTISTGMFRLSLREPELDKDTVILKASCVYCKTVLEMDIPMAWLEVDTGISDVVTRALHVAHCIDGVCPQVLGSIRV
jgi:hypothetical protein